MNHSDKPFGVGGTKFYEGKGVLSLPFWDFTDTIFAQDILAVIVEN